MNKNLYDFALGFVFIICSGLTYALDSTGNCDMASGTWSGSGKVKLLMISCGYDAKAQVSSGNPASANITVTRTSGFFLCPKKGEYQAIASCKDGHVVIKDDVIDVQGILSPNNTKLDLEGTIYAMYKHHAVKLSLTKE